MLSLGTGQMGVDGNPRHVPLSVSKGARQVGEVESLDTTLSDKFVVMRWTSGQARNMGQDLAC